MRGKWVVSASALVLLIFTLSSARHLCAGPLDNWTTRNSPVTNNLWGVTYGDGKFIAVGDQGTIISSDNGSNWVIQSSGVSATLRSVTYAAGRFAACGDGGTIIISTNGVDWSVQDSKTSNGLSAITYGNGTYVVVGPGAFSATSPDGSNWTPAGSGLTGDLFGVAYGNGLFISVGSTAARDSGLMFSSTDGASWQQETSRGKSLDAACSGAGTFVVGGTFFSLNQDLLLVSTNGNTWSDKSQGISDSVIYAAGYGNGAFVATFYALMPYGILYSTDGGASWQRVDVSNPNPYSTELTGVAFGADSFVVVGSPCAILQSGILPSAPNAPKLTVSSNGPEGGFKLNISGQAGAVYRIQASTNLVGTNWVDVGTITNAQSQATFTDPGATNFTQRFYRVVSP